MVRGVTFIRYCLVGVINTVSDVSIFTILIMTLQITPALANIISYTMALCVSFLLNRNFTFRSSSYLVMPVVQFYRFVAVNLISLVGSTTAIWLLSTIILPIVAKLVMIPLVTAWGFFAARLIVFPAKA